MGSRRSSYAATWWFGCVRGLTWGGVGWWAWWVAGSVGFVGREGELSRLQVAVGGDTRMLLVVGDAGVGKTRSVAEGLRRAAGSGVVVARGGCLPLAEQLPLLPMAGALGELAAVDGGALVEGALGVAPGYVRQEVGRLVPRLGHGAIGPGGRGGGWQRERLFSAVAELLGAVAARRAVEHQTPHQRTQPARAQVPAWQMPLVRRQQVDLHTL